LILMNIHSISLVGFLGERCKAQGNVFFRL